ncbi:MAG: hypothetical protein GTO63_36830, partial [Anaerolineae bacterium]|nr:hypothetical protein [Anaerolineae bacterium]NIO00320.1 hypothetical protein [Anaerolineae bacterium]NIQ83096.1 hypothetical protein [Anaerolineae bacterium]
GNVIHHIGRTGPEDHFQLDHGIYPCADYITITNNLIYEVRGFGIGGGAYGHTNDLLISNNTFVWPPNPPGAWRSPIVVTPCPKCVNGEVTENPELDNLTIQNN